MLIESVYAALAWMGNGREVAAETSATLTPAPICESVTPDALISFLDGKPYKVLKRHLTQNGLDAHTYRQKFGLPSDYPMVAPSYSERRSALARGLGLGNHGRGRAKSRS